MGKIFKTYCAAVLALVSSHAEAIHFSNPQEFAPLLSQPRFGVGSKQQFASPQKQVRKWSKSPVWQGPALPNAAKPATLVKSWGTPLMGARGILPAKLFANGNARQSPVGQGQTPPNAGKPTTLLNSWSTLPLTGIKSMVPPQSPPMQTASAKPPTNGTTEKDAASQGSVFSDFVNAPPSLEIWEKATGAWAMPAYDKSVATVSRFEPQKMAELAAGDQDILMATAVLIDQAPPGSQEQNFANFVIQAVEQGIQDNLSTAMTELNKFPKKSEFSGRQLQWIKFLAGDTVQGFRYANCRAFREDSDAHLETNHDYIQVVFPSWSPSQYANVDLYIRDNVNTWKALLHDCPTLAHNINLNMQLNAIRMLHFWKFKFAFERDAPNKWNTDRVFVVLEDNPNSPFHRNGDHNDLRATRLIESLKMFGCFIGLLHIFAEGLLPKYYSKHPSSRYWMNAWINCDIPNLYR